MEPYIGVGLLPIKAIFCSDSYRTNHPHEPFLQSLIIFDFLHSLFAPFMEMSLGRGQCGHWGDDIITDKCALQSIIIHCDMSNQFYLPIPKKQKTPSEGQDSSQPQHPPSVALRQGSEFAIHASSASSTQRRKKFITRMKEVSSQPPSNLLSSYQPQSMVSLGAGVTAREKNNLAARVSRRRKKMYIELLQQQNTNLQMEVYALGQEVEMLRTEIFNAIMHADQMPSHNAQTHSLVIKKLRTLSESPRSQQTEGEINICLDSCIYRIGSSGSERRAILDILYKGFINRNLPNIYRFILWSSLHGFDRNCVDSWWELMQSDLMKHSYNRFLDEQGDAIAFKGRQILRCARQILSKKKEIEQSGHLFDDLIKEMREILTPAQFAKLFLFADRATPKRQLQLFEGEALPDVCETTREEHYLASPARKRRKLAETLKEDCPPPS